MNFTRSLLSFVAIVVSVCALDAQIMHAGADRALLSHNPDAADSTFIFVYYTSSSRTPALRARTPGNDTAVFSWYRFDNSIQKIDPVPVKTEADVPESTLVLPVTEGGGYMLVYDDGKLTDTFRAWVFRDEVRIDSVTYVQDCDYLNFSVYPSSNSSVFTTYDYFDFCNLERVVKRIITNTYTLAWDADADIYSGVPGMSPAWKTGSSNYHSIRAPFAEAAYSVTITNVFGNKSKEYKTPRIPPMGVYAAFDVLKADKSGGFSPTSDLKGEALWRMKLDNKSINADKYRWIGLNNQDINFLANDTLWRFDTEDVIEEIVYKPGRYPVRLTVENTLTGCTSVSSATDSDGAVRNDHVIVVAPSEFAPESLPNAFTPNGDGNNDVFTFVKTKRPVSMNAMELKIVNRNGQLVYKYSGAVAAWEGWNGKVNGSGSDCASGVYYYIISGDGWDDKSYDGKRYSGFVHLFRNN